MQNHWHRSKGGSIQLPLLFALMLFLSLGLRFGDYFREEVVARKAVYGVEAAATAALYLLQPMEYTPPSLEVPIPPPALLDVVQRTTLVNGHYPELFEPITQADLVTGPVSVALSVHPLDPDMHSYTGRVYGIPAMQIGPGRVWTNEVGMAVASTGVFPLGVQRFVVPPSNPFPLPFEVVIGDASQPASFLQWGASDPAILSHLVALGYFHGTPPGGLPPPGMSVDQTVARLLPLQPMVDEIRMRMIGRVVLLPLLAGDRVTSFARARIFALTGTPPYRLLLGLSPSAAARSAMGPAQPRNITAPLPETIPLYGEVLRPWWSS